MLPKGREFMEGGRRGGGQRSQARQPASAASAAVRESDLHLKAFVPDNARAHRRAAQRYWLDGFEIMPLPLAPAGIGAVVMRLDVRTIQVLQFPNGRGRPASLAVWPTMAWLCSIWGDVLPVAQPASRVPRRLLDPDTHGRESIVVDRGMPSGPTRPLSRHPHSRLKACRSGGI